MYRKLLLVSICITLVLGFLLVDMYTSPTVRVNGTLMTQEEFRAMRFPTIAGGALLLAGLGTIVYCLRHIAIDRNTDQYGREACGIIADVTSSALRINGVAQMKAHVLVLQENGSVLEFTESIGDNRGRYCTGDFVRVKYLDEDVNILHTIDRAALPPASVRRLEEEFKAYLP